jgi:hypothetical protein
LEEVLVVDRNLLNLDPKNLSHDVSHDPLLERRRRRRTERAGEKGREKDQINKCRHDRRVIANRMRNDRKVDVSPKIFAVHLDLLLRHR